jgi:hypothetical protein
MVTTGAALVGALLLGVAGADGGALAPPSPSPAPSLTAAPPPGPGGFELHRAKDGSDDLTYDGPVFSARIGADGTVTFGPHRAPPIWSLPSLLSPIWPVPVDNGRPSLQSTLSAALRHKKPPAVERDKVVDESFLVIPNVSTYRPDPREGSRASFQVLPIAGATVGGDVTDTIMTLSGQDPYRIEKARFLTATRELRVRRAARAHAARIRAATTELPARLEAIAGDTHLTVAERRAILEALAVEMDDSPAGRDAAARIRAFLANDFATRFPPAPAK